MTSPIFTSNTVHPGLVCTYFLYVTIISYRLLSWYDEFESRELCMLDVYQR